MKQTITIDLPYPPSVNSVWRSVGKRVYKSKKYVDWIVSAGQHWMAQRPASKIKSIKGTYTLQIILNPPDKRRRDLGNAEKAASDFLQSAGVIENDHLCQKLSIAWSADEGTPNGMARLILTAC